jgi:putative tricarboxylic transport membrane protein
MFEHAFLGLEKIFSFPEVFIMFGGVVAGFIIGALPGFTSAMGMVVLLPLTFALTPIQGMLLLIGIFVAGIAGGCIPAIALNIPGTPASAATTFDGYPMFRSGRAEEALGIGIIASFIGGTVAAVILMVMAPQLARYALSFGAAEYCALGLLGLTLVVSVSETTIARGLFAALIGAFLTMIGTDPILGLVRFAGNSVELSAGISYVPALIGLFGFSEVITALMTKIKPVIPKLAKGLRFAFIPKKTLLRILPTSIRASLLGTYIGILPGVGADIGAFLSYDLEKKCAKDKSMFGKGDPRGIAASESGNNSNCGGAMIPMLTFGIPGDAQAAVLIAALMMHGIKPGPLLFTESPDLVWAIFMGLFVSQLMMLIVGLFAAPLAVRLVAQPSAVLFPIVSVLCIVGAFALNNSLFDVWIMLLFGFVGYFMKRNDLPVIPVVLAMILVPMVESELRRALMMDPKGFLHLFTRPIFSGIMGLSLVSLVASFILQSRSKKE